MKLSRTALIALIPAAAVGLSACSLTVSTGPSAGSSPAVTEVKPTEPAPSETAASPEPAPSETAATAEPTESSSPVEASPSASTAPSAGPVVKADPASIEKSAADALEKQVGIRPDLDCGTEKVDVKLGGTLLCALTAGKDPAVYDVTITFTEVNKDGTFKFNYQVADVPRS